MLIFHNVDIFVVHSHVLIEYENVNYYCFDNSDYKYGIEMMELFHLDLCVRLLRVH